MFRNHLKTALRNLLRYKATSAIHLTGLALGMACCWLILLYVTDEKSYDRWLPDAGSIYRVSMDIKNAQGEHLFFAPASGTLAGALQNYPQAAQTARVAPPFSESVPVSVGGERTFYETGFFWADPSVFELFRFDFLAGTPSTALQAPRDIVLTRDMAEKYFSIHGDFSQALGQVLKKDTAQYRVTAIIENIPSNTSFRPDFIASLKEFEGGSLIDNWHATVFHTFVKLKNGADAAAFGQQIRKIGRAISD